MKVWGRNVVKDWRIWHMNHSFSDTKLPMDEGQERRHSRFWATWTLVFSVSWFPLQTLNRGKFERRWVVVNIQCNDSFESHRLNRDVWRDESVEEILKASFLFWQRQSEHPDGVNFCRLYKISSFPFIGVIDPRTGRLLKRWDAKKFNDELSAASECRC